MLLLLVATGMSPQLSTAEAGFAHGCRAMDPDVTLQAIADKIHAWRKQKLRSRTGSGTAAPSPDASSVSRALNGKTHVDVAKDCAHERTEARGRKRDFPDSQVNKTARTLSYLETNTPHKDVTARQYQQEVVKRKDAEEIAPSVHTVCRHLKECGRGFLRTIKKLKLDTEKAAARLAFCLKYIVRSAFFFTMCLLVIDEGTLKYYTSVNARETGRRQKKNYSWRKTNGKDSREACRVTSSKAKHRPGIQSASVLVGVGAGKVQVFEFYEGQMGGEKYETLVYGVIEPAYQVVKAAARAVLPTAGVFLWRDGAPQSHESTAGKQAERTGCSRVARFC